MQTAGKLRKAIIFGIIIYIMAILCIPVTAAQDTAFQLDMDSLNLQKGVGATITLSLINAQNAEIISIDGLENFDVLSQSSGSSTTIANSYTIYQEDIYITVMPKVTGEFTLKANIRYNGQDFETNELQVTVSEDSSNNENSVPDLFMKTIVSHDEAYLGEKIAVTYELYTRGDIEGYGFLSNTAIDGVVVKDITSNGYSAESLYIDGNKYTKYTVKQIILDPIKSGAFTIPSFNFQVNVIESGRGGGFFGMFNQITSKYLQTEEHEILVKALPSEGKPDDFSGIVGDFKLTGSYSRDEMDYGDSFILQTEASGNCNLDGFKSIISGRISGLTVYENQKNSAESIENDQYYIEKTFEAILIPEKTGELDIPDISISYFNPITEKYEVAQIPGTTISVHGEMPQQSYDNSNFYGSIEPLVISQVNYSDTNGDYITIQIKHEWLYTAVICIAILLILTVSLILIISRRKKHDPALKSLYRQLLSAKDKNEIFNLFNAIIKHCYKLNLKASSRDMIQSNLPDISLAEQVTDIVDYMESSGSLDENELMHLKNKIKRIYTSVLRNI